jgi:hypothetical protein
MNSSPANTNDRDEVDPWFAFKLAVAAVAANYVFGPVFVIVFCAGWLWGVRDRGEEE